MSEAHSAQEYYHLADSTYSFSELSTGALTQLYFLKVQKKLAEYDHMDADQKMTWSLPKMKMIWKYKKAKLINALVEAEHM